MTSETQAAPKRSADLSNKFVRVVVENSSVFEEGEVVFVAGHLYTPDSQEMEDEGKATKKWGVNKVEDGMVLTKQMYTVPFSFVEAMEDEEQVACWEKFTEAMATAKKVQEALKEVEAVT